MHAPKRSMPRLPLTLGLTIAALGFGPSLGCGLEAIGDTGEQDAIPAEVQQAFDESCATTAACHAAGSSLVVLAAPESSAILTATSSSGGGPFVTLGDLDNSYIAQKILGGSNIIGGQMPPAPQSDDDALNQAIIVGWIAGVPLDGGGSGDGDGDGDPTGDGDGDGDGDVLCYVDALPGPMDPAPTFEVDIWPVVEARCATEFCHAVAAPVMSDAATAYANVVNVAHAASMLDYVEPGDADASYLWHKLMGTQATVGGSGGSMPSGGELCPIEIQAIYAWISGGADQ